MVSFAAQTNVVTHFLRNTILHCQAYEGSNQICIVIQFGSFRDFFFFLIITGQRTFVARMGGRKNFQRSKTFPRQVQEVFRMARTVGGWDGNKW